MTKKYQKTKVIFGKPKKEGDKPKQKFSVVVRKVRSSDGSPETTTSFSVDDFTGKKTLQSVKKALVKNLGN